jgi:hypothetical protein
MYSVGSCVTLTTRFMGASAGKILTPRRCNSSWNAADSFANSVVRSEERFRKSQVAEVACMEDQTLRANARADSSRESARAFCGTETKIRKNPRSGQRIEQPRECGEDRFCLADTGLPNDDITAASQGMEHGDTDVLFPFESRWASRATPDGKCSLAAKHFSGTRVHVISRVSGVNLCLQG